MIRRPIQEEVKRFVTDPDRYYAVTVTGRQINIVRSKNFQPPIEGEENFHTYLWVEALEGFFLFMQHFSGGVAGPWILAEEFVPDKSENFFYDFFDVLAGELK